MKKLMIAAATAAMVGGAFANTCISTKDECGEVTTGAGTAHKVVITLKSLTLKAKTSTAECTSSCTYWYDQGSVKINGYIWSMLDDCTGCTADFEGQKAAFWTDKRALPLEFAIGVGLIGKDVNSKKIQAYGALIGEYGELTWAGFGKLTGKTKKIECADPECAMWVSSISGNIAGSIELPEYVGICGEDCDPIEYAACCEDMQLSRAAAYGTIKIKYDATVAKRIAKSDDDSRIADFVTLPKAVSGSDVEDNTAEVTIEE